MEKTEFSVHLGGGLYMDSKGILSDGPDPNKPVYEKPGGGLPVDPGAVAKAFQGIAKALPDKDDPKSREKFDKIFDGIGMAANDKENLINLLQSAGAVASVIGSVVPVVGAILAVLTALLGLFKQGPSALEVMITRRFDELERKIKALETQIQVRDLRNQRNAISAALDAFANFIVELKNSPPDESALKVRQQELREELSDAGDALRNLLDTSTWLSTFDIKEHSSVWFWLQHRLYTFPVSAAPQRAVCPAQNANVFDHRLMVPLAIFGVTGFLTALRSLTPEFRSTREKREDLMSFANALEVLAENMRKEGLARTVYTAADFEDGAAGGIPWGLSPEEVIDFSLLGQPPRLAQGNIRWPVGALDLRAHDNAYFTPGFNASSIQHPGPQNARQGLLNLRWIPPARLEGYDVPVQQLGWEPANQDPPTQRRYRITNPDECARAANAQAEKDYVDLLYSSGYFNLIHLITTLRNEATDPDLSQTVRTEAWLRRKSGPTTSVTVESKSILFTGVISSPAERQSQEYKATIWFSTQPPGRDRKLNYRVWLRTLDVKTGTMDQAYDRYKNFHQLEYINDPDHPAFKKLISATGTPLAEIKIGEGNSIPEKREAENPVELEANTFDLWIPVKPVAGHAVSHISDFNKVSMRAFGWEQGNGNGGKLPVLSHPGDKPHGPASSSVADLATVGFDFNLHDYIGWQESNDFANGQQRLPEKKKVAFDCSLTWVADRLTVTLKNNRPEDRNYLVYVVVEETLGSGIVLHTIQPVPVTGQLTYVPQKFFDQEAEAYAKVDAIFTEFERRFSKSKAIERPGGGEPGPFWRNIEFEQLARDPVLRHLKVNALSGEREQTRLISAVREDPAAVRILEEIMHEANVREQRTGTSVSEQTDLTPA